MATLKDIALRAGVTHSIVSRVLTGNPALRVSPDTRALIRKVADELDYVPNESARSLRKARPQAIAMAMHDITNPVFTQIFVGAQEEADTRDHVLFVSEVSALASGNARLGKLIRGGAIDGVILLGLGTQQDADRSGDRDRQCPPRVPAGRAQFRLWRCPHRRSVRYDDSDPPSAGTGASSRRHVGHQFGPPAFPSAAWWAGRRRSPKPTWCRRHPGMSRPGPTSHLARRPLHASCAERPT